MKDSSTDPSRDQALPKEAADLRQQLADACRELAEGALERQELRDREAQLRHELHHRVRNTLATVRSIFSRTVNTSASLEQLADHFSGRLEAISRFQPIWSLESADHRGAFDLEHMLRDELHSFRFGDDPQIVIKGPEVRLQTDVAQLLGLAFHELVTNSIKFGVLAARDDRRRLVVSWTLHDDRLRILWRESGVSVITSAPMPRGFGREFIEEALPYQLAAETSFELRPGHVSCLIEIPLDAGPASGRGSYRRD